MKKVSIFLSLRGGAHAGLNYYQRDFIFNDFNFQQTENSWIDFDQTEGERFNDFYSRGKQSGMDIIFFHFLIEDKWYTAEDISDNPFHENSIWFKVIHQKEIKPINVLKIS